MDKVIASTLWANAIFQSQGSNELLCSICTTNKKFLDWKNHTESATHLAILERFKMHFCINDDETICCKICKLNFHREELEAHAKSHTLVPWHSPIDLYKIFFENHILEWEKQFYCYPCDAFFLQWFAVFAHIEEEKHKKLVKMEVPVNNLSSWSSDANIPYELLVNEGLITWTVMTFKCTICCRQNISLESVSQHVQEYQHVKLKVSFLRELSEWKRRKMCTWKNEPSVSAECVPNNTLDPPFVQKKRACIYITQNDDLSNFCNICNVVLSDLPTVDNHVRGIPHINALEKYGCNNIVIKDSKMYYCRCCDCRILGIHNVYLHVKGTRHAKSLSRINNSMDQQKDNSSDEIFVDQETVQLEYQPACLPHNYLVKLDNNKLFCQICNWTIISQATDDHVNGMRHTKSVKQFHENIILMNDNKSYCKCCDSMLSVKGLYRHLAGARHANSIKALNEQENEKNEITSDLESVKFLENSPEIVEDKLCNDHIVKINDDESCCEICDCKVSQSNIDAHVRDNEHVDAVQKFSDVVTLQKNDKYHCKDCDCTIRGIHNVYLHIHGNRHLRSGSSDKVTETLKSNKERSKFEKNMTESVSKKSAEDNISIEDISHDNLACNFETISQNSEKKKSNYTDEIKISINDELPVSGATHNDNMNKMATIVAQFLELGNFQSETSNNDKKRFSHYERNEQKIVLEFLDSEKDYIHDMRDKLREVELGMKLSVVKSSKIIYCLICRKDVAENWRNYCQHLWTHDHIDYLEGMEKDHATFELVPGQFSELDLAFQRIEEISEDVLHCHVCNEKMKNNDCTLRDHIDGKNHEIKSKEILASLRQNYDVIRSNFECDWYKIYKYSCAPCMANFQSELNFAIHLKSIGHTGIVKKLENDGKRLIHDFCELCGNLWYDHRFGYSVHCHLMHQSPIGRNEIIPKFPSDMTASVRYMLEHFDDQLTELQRQRETLIRDIENGLSVKTKKVIKFFNDVFPTCENLLLFLEKWLKLCGLSKITINALYWCIIFFLQTESIVPSVATVVLKHDTLDIKKFGCSVWSILSMKKLLIEFFTFYGNFDYQHDVACPLIGQIVKKRAFIDSSSLSNEMGPYIDYIRYSDDTEPFRIDSVMCIQYPFDFQTNLTEAVGKIHLSKFRSCCLNSSHALVD